jgi:hypothetical protein
MMILSLAHAAMDQASEQQVFRAWSDIVVGVRPQGLVDCFLSQGDGVVQVAALWETLEDHDRAFEENLDHPAFGLFAACGLDPTHTVHHVIGRFQSS